MNNRVSVSVKGYQYESIEKMESAFSDEALFSDVVETKANGKHFEKNGVSSIVYFDKSEEEGAPSDKCTLEVSGEALRMVRSGSINSVLFFEQGKTIPCKYITPYGAFNISAETKTLEIKKEPDQVKILLRYVLHFNDTPTNFCRTEIIISSLNSFYQP